jgi:hypothetical protein
VTPTLSEALALTVTFPETAAPLAGDVMLTLGAVVSGGGPFDTVTVTGSAFQRAPRMSCATARRECEPFATVLLSHATAYGDDESEPMKLPSA